MHILPLLALTLLLACPSKKPKKTKPPTQTTPTTYLPSPPHSPPSLPTAPGAQLGTDTLQREQNQTDLNQRKDVNQDINQGVNQDVNQTTVADTGKGGGKGGTDTGKGGKGSTDTGKTGKTGKTDEDKDGKRPPKEDKPPEVDEDTDEKLVVKLRFANKGGKLYPVLDFGDNDLTKISEVELTHTGGRLKLLRGATSFMRQAVPLPLTLWLNLELDGDGCGSEKIVLENVDGETAVEVCE